MDTPSPVRTVSPIPGCPGGGSAVLASDNTDSALSQWEQDLAAIERIELQREAGDQECFFRAMAERAQGRAR